VMPQRGEPHLPVQTRLMGSNKTGRLPEVARFPFELIRFPGFAIQTSLQNDFRTGDGHDGKKPVGIHQMERAYQTCHGVKDRWNSPAAQEGMVHLYAADEEKDDKYQQG